MCKSILRGFDLSDGKRQMGWMRNVGVGVGRSALENDDDELFPTWA